MPVSSETSISGPYIPNGVTTAFPFDFKATAAGEVVAVDEGGVTISTALYSVSLDDDEGGTLTFSVAPQFSDYAQIYVVSNPALTQPSDFDNAGPSFNPAALTRALDRAAARDLKQQREIDSSLKLSFGEVAPTIEPPAERVASGGTPKVYGFDPVTGVPRVLEGGEFRGLPGVGGNTFDSLIALKGASIDAFKSAYLVGVPGIVDGLFTWTLGNFTGQADDENIIKADSTALSVGAWVRQGAQSVTFSQTGTGAVIRNARGKAREVVSAIDFGAAGDGVTLDNAAITAAMTAHDDVLLPHGTYLIKDLAMLSGRSIRGQGVGATIIKFDPTGFRPFVMSGLSDIEISDLTIDANGGDFDVMLFTSCTNVRVKRVAITNSSGNGITADACTWCLFQDLDFYNTGGDSSDACVYLKNPTGDGEHNQVINARFRDLQGRGVLLLGQKQFQVTTLHGEMTNGEIALFEDCEDGLVSDIYMEGPGLPTTSMADGVAFNACANIAVWGFNLKYSSGHALSLNGQFEADGVTPKVGTHDCVVGPGTIQFSNEVGVALSDQSVPGSFPAKNRCIGVLVLNAGQQTNNPAFDCCGTDNHFTACTAQDGQGSPTGTWGFRELNASNVPARNTFSGQFIGTWINARYSIAVTSSSVIEELSNVTSTKVRFDGDTGGVATIIGTAWNIDSVTRDGEGDYIIDTVVPLPPGVGVIGSARSFAGYNTVVLDQVLSPTSYRVKVLAGGTTPNDSDLIFLEFR